MYSAPSRAAGDIRERAVHSIDADGTAHDGNQLSLLGSCPGRTS